MVSMVVIIFATAEPDSPNNGALQKSLFNMFHYICEDILKNLTLAKYVTIVVYMVESVYLEHY